MKKIFSMKRGSQDVGETRGTDTPEFNAPRGVRNFCESGAAPNSGEEVLHLPTIVESCESSPAAAAAAAYQIRKFLSKDNYSKPHVQYNAIMLIGILANNPGPTFTKNIDDKFKTTVRDLIKNSQDPSVQQMIRETLANLEKDKSSDTNLKPLLEMWAKEKDTPLPQNAYVQRQPQQAGGPFRGRGLIPPPPPRQPALPPPHELVGRVEEAKSSASLLVQLVQSTPPAEFASNDLIKEFASRCQTAQRSIQQYMNATDPSPDEATFKTLIETSEQLSSAQAKHQRAKLAAYKYTNPSPPPQQPGQGDPLAAAGAATRQPGQGEQPNILAPKPQRPQQGATAPAPTTTADNPFGDENRIPDAGAPAQQARQPYGNAASFELPTAPEHSQHPAFKSAFSAPGGDSSETYAPPPGPPPGQTATSTATGAPTLPQPVQQRSLLDDSDDMYNVSPSAERTTAPVAASEGAAPNGNTVMGQRYYSQPQSQDAGTTFADSQGRSWGDGLPYSANEARTLGNEPRVKDDDAAAAPAASGWRSYE